MKSFLQFLSEASSVYDVGHHTLHKDMKHVDLYHNGAVSGWGKVNHLDLYKKQRDTHERRTGYVYHPDSANHDSWVARHPTKRPNKAVDQAGDSEHYVQGRIDHKAKKYTINNSVPDKSGKTSTTHQARVINRLVKKTRNQLQRSYPDYEEHDAENTGVKGYHVD